MLGLSDQLKHFIKGPWFNHDGGSHAWKEGPSIEGYDKDLFGKSEMDFTLILFFLNRFTYCVDQDVFRCLFASILGGVIVRQNFPHAFFFRKDGLKQYQDVKKAAIR